MTIRFASVNTLNLYADPGEAARHARVEEMIRRLDADVIAVQEIVADDADPGEKARRAGARLAQVAEAVGRRCALAGQPVLAAGGGIHHVGLLWRDGITPVPGRVRRFGRGHAGLWHSMVTAVLDLGGPKVRFGSVQLSPFDQQWGLMDASQILRALNSDHIPGFGAGDFNGIGATRIPEDTGDRFYDPDPYTGPDAPPWHPDHVYQLDQDGTVDRSVAHRLESPRLGRLRDCAILTGTPWRATTGHWPADHHPPRRVDRIYATYHVPARAVTGFRVDGSDLARSCTDHLPVVAEITPEHLEPQPA
jgi:endonuclease/exonuclease/phosphatase family metal-dependent hydrolase